VNRERDQFDQIRLDAPHVLRRNGERLALLEKRLSEVFESARNHKPRVGQVEALRYRAGKLSASATTISPGPTGR
jgi:hypothetical protein